MTRLHEIYEYETLTGLSRRVHNNQRTKVPHLDLSIYYLRDVEFPESIVTIL